MTTAEKPIVRKQPARPTAFGESFIDTVCKRLVEGKRIRRPLPVWGRLHIDRPMPFLVVYRRPSRDDDHGTEQLVMSEASYLTTVSEKRLRKGLSQLIEQIARTMMDAFGSFLIVEVWAGTNEPREEKPPVHKPTFRIMQPPKHRLMTTVGAFEQALQDVSIQGEDADVEVIEVARPSPPGLPSLMQPSVAARLGCHVMGIEVRPVYRDAVTDQYYPMVHRTLRRRLSRAYKRGFFDFTRRHTTHRPPHYHALGPRAVVKAVWDVDSQLASVSGTFDFLLTVTPVNGNSAWRSFRRSKFQQTPEFVYRPLPMDPSLLKRRLYRVPIEHIEDPTLMHLFSNQQQELDRKITLLADRETRNFLYGSQQLFGSVDADLLNLAREILNRLPSRSREDSGKGYVNAAQFANRALEEIDYMRLTHPEIKTQVKVREDIVGLMVSRGNLLIGSQTRVPIARVKAAIAHEIGTHIVTYLNGRAQPFRQLSLGLPGYEELQEGLAVLSEYLVGGLSRPRLRLLAARVVATSLLVQGAEFIEVFRRLSKEYGFTQRTAYVISMRVFRGGGLTKDAVYLRGLMRLLEYLKKGGSFETLFVGKFAVRHVSIIQELQLRHVLGPAPFRPTFLDEPVVGERLARVRAGLSLLDLLARKN